MSRSDPTITVECDRCATTEEYGLTMLAKGWDDRDLDRALERDGWRQQGEWEDLCPECAAELEEEAEE